MGAVVGAAGVGQSGQAVAAQIAGDVVGGRKPGRGSGAAFVFFGNAGVGNSRGERDRVNGSVTAGERAPTRERIVDRF